MKTMNELTQPSALPLSTFSDIQQMGAELSKSRMFGVSNPSQGVALIVTSIQTGIPIFEINRKYHILTDGRMTMKADAMLAEFKRLGGKHKIISRTSECAAVELTYQGEANTFELKWEDAKQEPFTKAKDGSVAHNYSTPLKRMQMLWARVVSDGIRALCPEVNQGVYTPEEFDEMDKGAGESEPRDVTPPKRMQVTPEPEPEEVEAEMIDVNAEADEQADDATPFDDPTEADCNAEICPIGAMAGTRWEDMETERLNKVLDMAVKPEGITVDHLRVIGEVLDGRGE